MAEDNDKRIGANRSYLNEPFMTSLTSNISYTVAVSSWKKELQEEKLYNYCRIEFAMSDCNRTIHLDFSIDTKEHMRNSLYKLDTIIKVCEKMKEDIKIARKEILKAEKRKKEIKQD